MNDLSSNEEREVDNTLEADHEYETLDKYDQAYDEDLVKALPPKSESVQLQAFPLAASDDYKFTQCPAYVSTATTNVHPGNTNRSEYDVPSIPSTTAAQDDQN